MPVSLARAAAFDILLRIERESSYASELLHSSAYQKLSTPDHALATELVMGVLRWRSRLDDEITLASSQPLKKLDLEILIALRLALYQFRHLDRIPKRAALNESVELVKRARKRSAAPFVNAVLRKLSLNPLCSPMPPVVSDVSPQALAAAYAHPAWLVERWMRQYGPPITQQICIHNQSIPPTTLRLRTPEAESELTAAGISLDRGSFLSSAHGVLSGDVTKTQAFRTHSAVIQDEASQLVAALIGPDRNRILDCCAAPGGKTLAIADQNPGASITAVELHAHRARLMQKLFPADTAIQTVVADARHLPPTLPFDRVLADVPCSGTGTLARNPEIKWRIAPADLAELHDRQLSIVRAALSHLAPGGRLIYSTCSLEKEENEDVIAQALSENNSFRLLDCRAELDRLKATGALTWPDPASLTRGPYLRTIPGVHPCDGFFAAILERKI
ncbi:MAG TPA: 16S rRNA (cytosine(967)-C(5))-methyltransferase RsmB [Candidatus Dormibacteraeota bacterium]|nr:16S rRNA (cytosine(967)-C(5))-methyltransferase RsmB [Candidatus Dormibacteraeota bacterium]